MTSGSNEKDAFVKERPLTPKSNEKHLHDTTLFTENINLIHSNQERILITPQFFNVRFKGAHFGAIHIGAEWYLPLGVLILLWREGTWLKKCQECCGTIYVYSASGSPLSGSAHWRGVCAACGRTFSERDDSFGDLFKPAFEMRDRYMIKIRILKTGEEKFSRAEGVKGEEVEEIVTERGKEAVEMEVLVVSLRGIH